MQVHSVSAYNRNPSAGLLPRGGYRSKHPREDDIDADRDIGDDEEQDGGGGGAAPYAPSKRRKLGSIGAADGTGWTGFEPSLHALSLDGEQQQRHQQERENTPYPLFQVDSSSLSSSTAASRRARPSSNTTTTRRVRMERHDPSRPHVVFVDSLSDTSSDDDEEKDGGEGGGSTSAMEEEETDETTTDDDEQQQLIDPNSPRIPSRPIKVNRRLRDHLRRQALLRSGAGVVNASDSSLVVHQSMLPPTTERGLVLYRPLNFGTVEEPDDDECDGGRSKGADGWEDAGPRIEEILDEDDEKDGLPLDEEEQPQPARSMSTDFSKNNVANSSHAYSDDEGDVEMEVD